ncbi:type IV secretion system protein TraC [Azohydromonas aeria]|uniref:type IV secretion system protein TraC n=1 Tax=Azohydromonas aeria TaxID=2590212 RepID=UPI0012FCB7CE|nr:type IV secretion system protein TraC [Azohydromonas aeria]
MLSPNRLGFLTQILRGSPSLGTLLGLETEDDSPADRFASWLPYYSYFPHEQLFENKNGIGFLLEVMPQSGADERMVDVLRSFYAALPAGTGVQFSLFGSPHVRPILRDYAAMRMEDHDQSENARARGRPVRNENLFRTMARRRFQFLADGAHHSLTNGFHYCLRNFRLMASVTMQGDAHNSARRKEIVSVREGLATTLRAASLPNRVCDARDLINWCRPFVNPDLITSAEVPEVNYDPGREIRDQIVDHDTIQDPEVSGLKLWKPGGSDPLEVRFLSIKSFPERYFLWQMGALAGDLMQPALQYNCPFLLTMGVHILDTNGTRTAVTANNMRATQNAGSKLANVMPDVDKKARDWSAAAEVIDMGGTLVSLYHELALFVHPSKAVQAQEAAKSIWRARGFELNPDSFQHRQALIASLPMTLSPKFHADMRKMKRVSRKTDANAVHLAPLLAEWRGTRTPTLILGGRRGQLTPFDLYDNDLGNPSAGVIGAPGSGKSTLLNEFAWSYRAIGAKVWMCDLGRSFEKLCHKAGGRHIEFRPDSRINLNPFSVVSEPGIGEDGQPEGGIEEDIDMLKPALAKMCSMSSPLSEVQIKALGTLTLRLYREYGRELTITGLRDACKSGTIADLELKDDQRIRDLAIMLTPYCKDGEYARFFEGKNNVDFENDFIVIENEELKRRPELHAVVNILLLYQITGMMYLTRDRKKLLVIDELKQQLGEIGADDPIKAAVVEEAARRARKYGGALVTATHSAEDYFGSKQMEAALACCDWMFLLRQKVESVELLARSGKVAMDEAKKRLVQSLRTEPGVFAECYVSSPVGEGVGRIILDPYSHLLFSNRIEDNAPLDELRRAGYSIDEAITELLRRRGHRV